MGEWIRGNETLLWWLGAASIVTFVGTLVAVPVLLARIPADYFAHRARHRLTEQSRHPFVATALLIGKNALGGAFVIAGVAMLVLPGQGLITVVIGLWLMDFPGKYRFERWLVGRRAVLRAANWIRARAGAAPLRVSRPAQNASEPRRGGGSGPSDGTVQK